MSKPEKIRLYAYNVYFGDCFLLVFDYPNNEKKSVLIDFGSTGKGNPEKGAVMDESDEANKDSTGARLLKVAEHIRETSGGSLDVVVATHRHKDHIYGFGLKEAGKILLDCKPKVVIQPWTEDPEDDRDLTKKNLVGSGDEFKAAPRKHFASMLNDMHTVAAAIESEAKKLADEGKFSRTIDPKLKDRIVFAADDNKIKNKAAVDNLHAMGQAPGQSHYVHFGYENIDWDTILPGVRVRILGPPRLEDSDAITSATNTSSEFWSLQAMNQYFWGMQAATSGLPGAGEEDERPLFGREYVMTAPRPPNVRWIIRQLRSVRASQLLEIVKFVDTALNNTSVIMLFETGDQKLLFPGDAQIENWQFALSKPEIKALLKETTVYKVGHHGSRNATPKSLWKDFAKKSDEAGKAGRLKTVISTMKGKHGETPDTAVPLPKMVDTMKKESTYTSTEDIKNDIVTVVEIPVG